jgi:phenylpropionate dioxygenase-like ring-hydroxylating dioxygenase large terminal subunit
MFLRNAWYVAAWDREVSKEKPFARTLLNEPIVFYRQSDGTPVALEDRCCHRHAQLSLGVVVGDNLRCSYHGLKFDAAGACVGYSVNSVSTTPSSSAALSSVQSAI